MTNFDKTTLKKIGSLTAAVLLLFNTAAFGDAFLDSAVKDGIGVRPLGMGGAFVSLSDDSNCVYYNPGALADMKTQYTRGYLDVNTDYYAANDYYTVSVPKAGFGSWNVADKSGDKASVTAFSFGSKLKNGVGWGVTYKNIAWSSSGIDARGWTMDAGLKATLSKEITAGVLIQDLVKNSAPLSTSVRAGVSMLPEMFKGTAMVAEGEFRNLRAKTGTEIYMHYGIETKIADELMVRGGWSKDKFSIGATMLLSSVSVDYATIVNSDEKNIYMMSFKLFEQ